MPSKRDAVSSIKGPRVTGGPGSGRGMRGFNINDFRAYRNAVGILRTHDFHIEMPWPLALQRLPQYNSTFNNIELSCDSINFPATAAVTHKMQRYGYGAQETRPTMPQFSDLQCSFISDESTNLWRWFHDWLQLTVNYDFDENPLQSGQMNAYEISYKDEYAVDMKLYIYNPYGGLVRKVSFRQTFPTVVADCPLAWAAGNQMIKIPVTFAFTDWNEEIVPPQSSINVG